MSQGGAWDFVPVRLCASRQGAAVGQTDAGKSSRTLALLRRFTLLAGQDWRSGARANKRKIPDSGKFLLLPLRDFSCGRGKVSAAQALPIWG